VCVELGGRRGRREAGACSSHRTHEHARMLVAHARCERALRKRPPLATAPPSTRLSVKGPTAHGDRGTERSTHPAITLTLAQTRGRAFASTHCAAHTARHTTTPDKARLGVRVFCNAKQNRSRVPHDVQPLATPPLPPTHPTTREEGLTMAPRGPVKVTP
jgi:hypothetical protein